MLRFFALVRSRSRGPYASIGERRDAAHTTAGVFRGTNGYAAPGDFGPKAGSKRPHL